MIATLLLLTAAILPAQDFSEIRVERVSAGHRFTEGPVWSREGYLLFSDVPNNVVIRLDAKGGSKYRENTNGGNGNAFDPKGRLYSCESHTRRVIRLDKDGKPETLAERWEGKRLNAPNDLVVRKDGHIWFTDPAFGEQADHRELDFYGVFHITPKGELELVAKPQGRPNGIALSPNGRILYVTNSDERNVRAYDVDRNGEASNERVLIDKVEGIPDGMAVDEKGNLYIACRGIAIYSAEGKLLHTVEIPETPSNCAFGEEDLMSLMVTARTSVYRIRLDVKGSLQY